MDAEQDITEVTPNSKSWSCKVIVIEKLNERESRNGVTYRPIIMQDYTGHKVKAMTYGQDIAIIDNRLQLNETYKISDAKVSPAISGFAVPDETYRQIWTINRRTMIHDVCVEEKLVIQPSAEPDIDSFSLIYKAMVTKKKINVLAIVISKLERQFVVTRKGMQQKTSDFIIIDQECKPLTLTMWDKFASVQGGEIERALQSDTYPTIFAKRIVATSYQGLSLTTQYDSSVELNPVISPASTLEEWRSSNTASIEYALQTKQFQDPLSLFVKPGDFQKILISEVADTENEEDVYWVEGKVNLLENEQDPLYIGCGSCNRKVDFREGITFKCMQCGDNQARTIKRFKTMAQINDGNSALHFTIFTRDIEKIIRALEMNTPLEFIQCVNINKALESIKVTAAVKLAPISYQTRPVKVYLLLCLYDFSSEQTTTSSLKRKLNVEDDKPKIKDP